MFREIFHTADVGLYIESTSYKGLFYDAAIGLMFLSGIKISNENNLHIVKYKNKAVDKETLLVDWLDFLVYQLEKNFYLVNCNIRIKKNSLFSICYFNEYKKKDLLIKSATFHNLNIIKEERLIKVTVIFDV